MFLQDSLRKTRIARQLFEGELKSLGLFEVFKSDSNMIMVKMNSKETGKSLQKALINKGFLTVTLEDYLLLDEDYLHFGVRDSATNGLLIEALKSIGSQERLVA